MGGAFVVEGHVVGADGVAAGVIANRLEDSRSPSPGLDAAKGSFRMGRSAVVNLDRVNYPEGADKEPFLPSGQRNMILITTDGSQRSTHVIPHAAALARTGEEQVTLLRIFDPEELALEPNAEWPARLEREIASLESEMSKQLAKASVIGAARAEPLLKGESVPEAILRVAAETEASLIAMDSRGHGAIRHALLGSVTMEVLAHSPLPVMVTGPEVGPAKVQEPYVIVATTDCSPASEQVFLGLKAICALPSVSIALTNVYVPALGDKGEQAEVQERHEYLAGVQRGLLSGARCELIVRRAHDLTMPESLVLDTARDMRASAIAMSTKGHSAQRHVVLGSFAAAVLARSTLPLILVRA